jgi:hypothetical protein
VLPAEGKPHMKQLFCHSKGKLATLDQGLHLVGMVALGGISSLKVSSDQTIYNASAPTFFISSILPATRLLTSITSKFRTSSKEGSRVNVFPHQGIAACTHGEPGQGLGICREPSTTANCDFLGIVDQNSIFCQLGLPGCSASVEVTGANWVAQYCW